MRMIILGVAVLAAGGAGYLALNLATPEQQAQVEQIVAAPEVELDKVLVAVRTLTTGEVVQDAVRWQKWPVEALSPDFITESARPEALEEFANSVVRSTISEGEPVRLIKLLGADQSFMSSILPSGKRAVATQIAADTSAGGFILPDDFVDVIMTRRPRTDDGTFITETILENIRILAIDQTIREDEEGRLVQVGQTATLELTPQQAEIITVAQQMADRLTLALRSVQDVNAANAGKDANHLLGEGPSGSISVIKRGAKTSVTGG